MRKAKRLYKPLNKRTIYILGNPNYEQDSLPIKLLPKLQSFFPSFQFIHIDPTENLPEQEHLVLIDTILNIGEIKILTENDLDKIQSSPNYSLHDFDLGFQLKLMKKLNKVKKFTIIGLPPGYSEVKILQELKNILKAATLK